MSDADRPGTPEEGEPPESQALPQDVTGWLKLHLDGNESVSSFLFADIEPDGTFGERWTFLTNRRLLVLAPNGQPDRADLLFNKPLGEIREAEVRDYVGSSALVVRDAGSSHEVARFSLASKREASEICTTLNEAIGEDDDAPLASDGGRAHRPTGPKHGHRCPKCGRAKRKRGDVCPHCIDRRRILVRLFSFLMPFKGLAVLGLVMTLTMTALQLVPPYLTKVIVDDVIPQGNAGLLAVVVALMVGLYLARTIISIFRTYFMQLLGNRVLLNMRIQVYDHLQLLTLQYYNQKQTGRIMSRVTGDLGRLQYFISEGFQEILVNIFTVLLIAGILLAMDWRLFLLALAPVPIITISSAVFGQRVHLLYHRIWRRMSGLSGMLADTIPGIRVVKSFAQEERESERFGRLSVDLYHQEMRAVKLWSVFFPFLGLMTGLGSILIFSVGSWMVLEGVTTLGVLIAFTSYLWRLYMPIEQFGRINHKLQHCTTSAERIFDILDAEIEPVKQPGVKVVGRLEGKVEFRNVRFGYEPGTYALDGVSFVVEPGEMIGLVGASGAGKSTLVQLLARFYEIDEGQILIDDDDIRDLSLWPFRRQIGVVLQEPYLFHGTVWENIAYANPDASPDEIITAARAANVHEFVVSFPDGYDTLIGERGQTLSGGERQRVSIARAILRDPRLLILDEATASVDTHTEMLIQTAVERLVENRTTFAIAHRLSTLRKANRVMVLERGRLAEMGTHEELIEADGIYAKLCRMQSDLSKFRAW